MVRAALYAREGFVLDYVHIMPVIILRSYEYDLLVGTRNMIPSYKNNNVIEQILMYICISAYTLAEAKLAAS